MDTCVRQPSIGQTSLLLMAFASPFAVHAGTGGYIQAQPVESSGNSIFVQGAYLPTAEEKQKATFTRNLLRLHTEYALGKDQLATMLNVSRRTIYDWLNPETQPGEIRERYFVHLSQTLGAFDRNVDPSLRQLMGQFLRKKLDPSVKTLLDEHAKHTDYDAALKALNFKLKGVESSDRLSSALKNKKPLI